MMDLFARRAARFPVYEVLVAIYVAGALTMPSNIPMPGPQGTSVSDAGVLFNIVRAASAIPSFLTYIVMIKTIAYDIGVEVEKRLFLTYLSLPIKRLDFIILRYLASAGLPLAAYIFALTTTVFIKEVGNPPLTDVLLIFLAHIGPIFMFSAITFLLALLLKKGGLGLVMAIVLWVILDVISGVLSMMAMVTGSREALNLVFILSPNTALGFYYMGNGAPPNPNLKIGFWEVLELLSIHYVVSLLLLATATYYFVKRYEAT